MLNNFNSNNLYFPKSFKSDSNSLLIKEFDKIKCPFIFSIQLEVNVYEIVGKRLK